MNAEQRSVFQGIVYYYREHTVLCRYELTVKDPVDAELLQQACDEARPLAGYFFQKVVWEKREAHLAPNDAPFRVRIGHVQPHIPEDTDDYQLAFSCEGNQIFFDWFHFLADGRGVSRLVTLVLKLYCNLRYGTAFACEPLVSDPPYDIEDILARYPESQVENDMQKEVTQTSEAKPQLVRVRLDKQSLLDAALPLGVKPFSALMALFCKAGREYFGRDDLRYNYSTDARDAMGTPKALFNCVASFQRPITVTEADTLATLVPGVEADIRHNLTKEPKLFRVAEQMGWVYKVNQQKAPLRIKQRVFQMGEYIGGTISDFWLSYLGNPLMPATPELAQYTTDFGVWVPPDGASVGVEAASLNGKIILCIHNKAPHPGLADILRKTFENEGVTVLEAADLD